MRVDPLVPRAEKLTLVLEAIPKRAHAEPSSPQFGLVGT
jgi:hypothetical protein